MKSHILLTFGKHSLTVKTGFEPLEVFVAILDEGTPVCGGSVSVAGTTLSPDGFVLYADIAANSARVKWHAVQSEEEIVL